MCVFVVSSNVGISFWVIRVGFTGSFVYTLVKCTLWFAFFTCYVCICILSCLDGCNFGDVPLTLFDLLDFIEFFLGNFIRTSICERNTRLATRA